MSTPWTQSADDAQALIDQAYERLDTLAQAIFGYVVLSSLWRGEDDVVPIDQICRALRLPHAVVVDVLDRSGCALFPGLDSSATTVLANDLQRFAIGVTGRPPEKAWRELRAVAMERALVIGCYRPGCDAEPTDADHLTPVSRGGSNHPSNLFPLCGRCNSEKGTRTIEEWWPLISGGMYAAD